ncbi:hypothetical protein D3C78_1379180 [compost metagenome]
MHFQRVVQGRVDQFDHDAGVFADAGQGQALQVIGFGAGVALGVERLHRMEAFFVTRQIGLQVIGMHQVQRRALQAFIDPGQARTVEGVGEHTDDRIVMTQQDEFALEALGQGHPVEHRGGIEQAVGVEHRVVQGYAEALNERHGSQIAQSPQGVQHPLAGTGGQGSGLGQLFTAETSRCTFRLRRFYGKG